MADVLTKRLDVRTEQLMCRLTEAERNERGRDLAKVDRQIDQLIKDQAAVKKDMARALAALQERRAQLSAAADTGEETRGVRVEVIADYGQGVAETVRTDTSEILSTRPLTTLELQRSLPGTESAPATEAK